MGGGGFGVFVVLSVFGGGFVEGGVEMRGEGVGGVVCLCGVCV